jgi:hypothetical protein
MRTIVLAMVVAAGIPLAAASPASAMPAQGAAIAGISHEVAPAINVATKKSKKAAQGANKGPCPADQVRSNRTGYCRPLISER